MQAAESKATAIRFVVPRPRRVGSIHWTSSLANVVVKASHLIASGIADPDPGARATELIVTLADHKGIAGAIGNVAKTDHLIMKDPLRVIPSLVIVTGSSIAHVVGNRWLPVL